MDTDTALAKISDERLRRFAEKYSDGLESVLIELEMPTTKVVFTNPGKSQSRRAKLQQHRPFMLQEEASHGADERVLVEQLEKWFNDIGLNARYLRSARAFAANVTSSQLRKVVVSSKVRSIAANSEVSIAG